MDLVDELHSRVVCGDGAMGTQLLDYGVSIDQCLEELCLSEPERIKRVHEEYISAGARVIETNTFGANAVRLRRWGLEERVGEVNRAAVRVAREAAKALDVYVAGAVGPLGICGSQARAQGIDRAKCFSEQISSLLDGGVDVIFLETFTGFEEIEIALAAKNELSDIPAICSVACGMDGRLSCGMSLVEAFAKLGKTGAQIVGLNCMKAPQEMLEVMRDLSDEQLLAIYPTAGQPREQNGRLVYDVTPESFAASVGDIVARGARLLGGCCGTSPTHIAALAAAIATLPP